MLNKIFRNRVIIIILFFFLIPSFSVIAYKIEVGIPGAVPAGTDVSYTQYINGIYKFAFSIIGIVAFGSLVLAGIMYITSTAVGEIGAAKTRIWNTIGGVFLALCAALIFNIINSGLTNVNLLVPGLGSPSAPATLSTTPATTPTTTSTATTGLTATCCYAGSGATATYLWHTISSGKTCYDLTSPKINATDAQCLSNGAGPKP